MEKGGRREDGSAAISRQAASEALPQGLLIQVLPYEDQLADPLLVLLPWLPRAAIQHGVDPLEINLI